MIRRLLCWLTGGHGPWDRGLGTVAVLHEGELRRARRCGYCKAIVMVPEVDG